MFILSSIGGRISSIAFQKLFKMVFSCILVQLHVNGSLKQEPAQLTECQKMEAMLMVTELRSAAAQPKTVICFALVKIEGGAKTTI